ncbi:MAG: uracil-DNA glycosylase family protein [Fidelibacterota bacterium]
MGDSVGELEDLRQRILACTRCPLHLSRNRAVAGEGNPGARLVLVGQGPGDNEDASGRPFVGRAGDLLNQWLRAIGIDRREVWITNVTRCLPPAGRLPRAGEIRTCAPYLLEEMGLIKPKVVSPLGNIALQVLLGRPVKIQEVQGKPIARERYFLFPLLHPAAVLRRPDLGPAALAHVRALKTFLDSDPVLEPPPGQESLF